MEEFNRLRKENEELREKLKIAIEIVNELIKKGNEQDLRVTEKLRKKIWEQDEKLKAAS